MILLIQDPKKPGLPTLVLYDIEDDKRRTKVMDSCKDYGLARLQLSAYQGKLTRTARKELEIRMERALGNSKGFIWLIQFAQKHIDDATIIQNIGDEDE